MSDVQEVFFENEEFMRSFRETLGEARFARYLKQASGEQKLAIRLYQWNARLSQSMYLPLQAWKVALRNRLNAFLCWKYSIQWPHQDRLTRQLKSNLRRKLEEAIARQEETRGKGMISTDMIVADLSAGFWVSLLSASYDVPFSFRHNIRRIFPHSKTMDRKTASGLCAGLLDLRNRVAHHEPIYHLALRDKQAALGSLLDAMCRGSYAYANTTFTLDSILRDDPRNVAFRASASLTLKAGQDWVPPFRD